MSAAPEDLSSRGEDSVNSVHSTGEFLEQKKYMLLPTSGTQANLFCLGLEITQA